MSVPGPDGRSSPRSFDGSFVVGRDPGCDLVLDEGGASRRHCRFDPGDGGWNLVDLGSANGTFVNGERLTEAFLVGGETIRLGTIEVSFELVLDELSASQILRQTLSVRPTRRLRPLAAVVAVSAGVLLLLVATAWQKGCFERGGASHAASSHGSRYGEFFSCARTSA